MFKCKRVFLITIMSVLLFIAFTPSTLAHVTVNPSNSEINEYVKYGVRVPVEKEINTTALKLMIPDEINIISIEPTSNWDYELERNDSNQIISITWIANNGGIGPNEFVEFSFIGVNPKETGELSWEALQTYEDDSIVEWVDPPGSEEPASITNVVAQGPDADTSSESSTTTNANQTSWLPMGIALLALFLSFISLFRKRT